MTRAACLVAAAIGLVALPNSAWAQDAAVSADKAATSGDAPSRRMDELLGMSLEDVLSQEVTSVAKKAQHVGDAPAAVYVISQDQISRSGALALTDLLRRVPGLEVFQLQGSATSVSARGFSSRFAANLLVMVDGAAIYNTPISGMFWDQAIFPLQDIERIEVIRGPGGTLWGSNSINGVINIITKQSVDTQGLHLDVKAGARDMRGEFGYGAQLSPVLGVRVYGTYRHSKGLQFADGRDIGDKWNGALGGVRLDYAPSDSDSVVVLGELSGGRFTESRTDVAVTPSGPAEIVIGPRNTFDSEHVLARWKHIFAPDFELTGQVYFNRLYRVEVDAGVSRDLYDASLEGHWRISRMHDVNFGISGRISHDAVGSGGLVSFPSGANTDRWLTGYLQDEIALVPDTFTLTAGSKFELNNFNGFHVQPSLRLFYRHSEGLAFWGAVSRATRTSLLQQREMNANFFLWQRDKRRPQPVLTQVISFGNKHLRNESLLAFEAGMRASLSRSWSLGLSGFRNLYDKLVTADLISSEPLYVAPYTDPVGIRTLNTFRNNAKGRSWGFELLLSGQITPQWKTELSYSYLDLRIDTKTVAALSSVPSIPRDASSRHQVRVSTSYDIGDKVSLEGALHYVSRSFDAVRPGFADLDLRAAYRPLTNVEIAVSGSHLLKPRHLEYYTNYIPLPFGYVPRVVTLETRVRF